MSVLPSSCCIHVKAEENRQNYYACTHLHTYVCACTHTKSKQVFLQSWGRLTTWKQQQNHKTTDVGWDIRRPSSPVHSYCPQLTSRLSQVAEGWVQSSSENLHQWVFPSCFGHLFSTAWPLLLWFFSLHLSRTSPCGSLSPLPLDLSLSMSERLGRSCQ